MTTNSPSQYAPSFPVIFEYDPRIVKMVLTGYGFADKYQMQHMVKTFLNLKKKKFLVQVKLADAIAIAICHINTIRWNLKQN
jgi:crossover junction endodeoxyribonuclease RuvC